MSFKWSDWHNKNNNKNRGWDQRGDNRDHGHRRGDRYTRR
jgi:hypothetical protein